jgi:tetratricopeptide (TPR) repeat protein
MARRFRRRSRTHSADAEGRRSRLPSSPFNLLWIIFGVVVLAAVIFYDQRQIAQAKQHIDQAQYFQQHGVYAEALKEYQRAYANKRLGRHQKGDVALAIGDIYYDQFENYDMAHTYFVRAKQDNPKLFQNNTTQERLKAAAQRSAGSGVTKGGSSEEETTSTVIQRVQLVAAPQEDQRGPVIARYKGGEIHAGEFLRFLQRRPEYTDPHFREDPRKLEDLLKQYLASQLRYQAGLDAGIQRDPDISARLFDYQKTLIAERFAVTERQKARSVTPQQVQEYYEQNKSQYVQPASAEIAMIKCNTEAEAQQALQQIRAGATFRDVATSISADEKSAKQGGTVGTISENDKSIPGVGDAPELVKELVRLRANQVTAVTPFNGAFYVFRSLRSVPARNTSLDEARAEIQMRLMGKAVDAASTGLEDRLRATYEPQVSLEGMQRFWQFAAGENASGADRPTSGTVSTAGTSATAEAAPAAGVNARQ